PVSAAKLKRRGVILVELAIASPTPRVAKNGPRDGPQPSSPLAKTRPRFSEGDPSPLVGILGGPRLQRQLVDQEVPILTPPRSAVRQTGIGQNFQTQALEALPCGLEHERVGVVVQRLLLVHEDGTIWLQFHFGAGFGFHLDR